MIRGIVWRHVRFHSAHCCQLHSINRILKLHSPLLSFLSKLNVLLLNSKLQSGLWSQSNLNNPYYWGPLFNEAESVNLELPLLAACLHLCMHLCMHVMHGHVHAWMHACVCACLWCISMHLVHWCVFVHALVCTCVICVIFLGTYACVCMLVCACTCMCTHASVQSHFSIIYAV